VSNLSPVGGGGVHTAPQSPFYRRWIQLAFIGVLCLLLAACNLTAPATPQTVTQPGDSIVAAWVDAGNLIVWRLGEDTPRRVASGGVVRPYVAPDGEHIAFTRGPNGVPSTLWVVDTNGNAERQLVGDGEPRNFRGDESQVGDVGWYDERILYFNTLAQATPAYTPRDDLYRANIHTREIALIRRPSEGGRFAVSPDKQWLAVVSSGTYGRQDGLISVIDPLGQQDARNLLFYIGVASGSHTAFYPELFWSLDSSAIYTAVPDADLIYADAQDPADMPPTRLWRLPIDTPSDRELMGSVPASFFGLPRWSADRTQMLYMQREAESNTFTVYTAAADGSDITEYVSGEAGQLERPRWLPETNQFIYTLGDLGTVYLGVVGEEPRRLSEEVVITPQFISADRFVFATLPAVAADGIQLRHAQMGSASQPIAPAGAAIPIFDAVWVTAHAG